LDLSTELKGKLATGVKRLKADVSSVSPSSERIRKELWVERGLYGSGRVMLLVGTWQREKTNPLVCLAISNDRDTGHRYREQTVTFQFFF